MDKRFKGPFHRNRFSPIAIVGMVIGGLALAVVFAFLFGWLVMILWNWLMPTIFGLPAITYWQGWGLVLLSHILIKGGWGSSGGEGKCGKGHKDSKWPDGPPCCDDCGWKEDCAKYAHHWRRTADGWKCDAEEVKKDLSDRVGGEKEE